MCNDSQGYYQSNPHLDYFAEQLQQAKPLTQEDIDRVNETRREHSAPPCTYEVGDFLLYGLVLRDDPNSLEGFSSSKIMDMLSFIKRDNEIIGTENLVFQRMSTKFPVFTLKEGT